MKNFLLQGFNSQYYMKLVPGDTAEEAIQTHLRAYPEDSEMEFIISEVCYPLGVYGLPKPREARFLRAVPEQNSTTMPNVDSINDAVTSCLDDTSKNRAAPDMFDIPF